MKRSREPEEHIEFDPQDGDSHHSANADADLRPVSKIAGLDSAVEDEDNEFVMRCSLPPHKEPLGFRLYSDYETHYHNFHTNRCIECRKNFPTDHLLSIHIEECHDPLARVAREKGEHTYSCFVEGCDRKCMTPQKRRLHLIDKHMYPKNFFFAVTKDGIDGKRSLLIETRRRRSSAGSQPQAKELRRRANTLEKEAVPSDNKSQSTLTSTTAPNSKVESEKPADTEMADLTGAMSALQFVPPSIRFGRGRAGFSKR
ncbi:Zinc finger protein [Trichoderma lentiforme]|uniref:Zinc finger protein n=1 Tax=Trichoderma lentiforme TaxID=1567552 RepID=A0A9P5CEP3_9HYPO|nr:Zinc finger protein [Trichoderma lentiforme]